MAQVESAGTGNVTMPAQFPEWFDPRYEAPAGVRFKLKRRGEYIPGPAERERVEAGFAKLSRDLRAASKGTSMDMRSPHPLPQDRINEAAE